MGAAVTRGSAVHDSLRTGESNEGMYFAARTLLAKAGISAGTLVFASLLNLGRRQRVQRPLVAPEGALRGGRWAAPLGALGRCTVALCQQRGGPPVLRAATERADATHRRDETNDWGVRRAIRPAAPAKRLCRDEMLTPRSARPRRSG